MFGQMRTVRPKDDGVNLIVNVEHLRPGATVRVTDVDLFALKDAGK